MTSTEIQSVDNEIIANQLIRLFGYLMKHPDLSKQEACDELGMDYRRTLRWINEGKLKDYLSEIHDPRSDMAQIIALDELQSIVRYQAKIARGEVTVQGSNPTTAANFVLDVAKMGAHKDAPTINARQINVFVPEMGQQRKTAEAIDAPAVRELPRED